MAKIKPIQIGNDYYISVIAATPKDIPHHTNDMVAQMGEFFTRNSITFEIVDIAQKLSDNCYRCFKFDFANSLLISKLKMSNESPMLIVSGYTKMLEVLHKNDQIEPT